MDRARARVEAVFLVMTGLSAVYATWAGYWPVVALNAVAFTWAAVGLSRAIWPPPKDRDKVVRPRWKL